MVWLKPLELAPSQTTAELLSSLCLCNSSIPSSKVLDSVTATCFAGCFVDSDQVTFFSLGEDVLQLWVEMQGHTTGMGHGHPSPLLCKELRCVLLCVQLLESAEWNILKRTRGALFQTEVCARMYSRF